MKRPAVVLIAAVVIAGLAVAWFIFRPRNEIPNVRELAARMEDAGIACEDLNVSAPDPTPEIVDFGSCQIDGKTVNLHVYKSSAAVDEHIEGNVAVRGQNPNYFTSLVAGSNWVVDTYSKETTRRIQAALGGEIH